MNRIAFIETGRILNMETSKQLKSEFDKMVEKGYREFEIEMRELTYINLSGLSALFYISKKACENGYSVRMVNPNSTIAKVLRITNADMYAKVEEYKEPLKSLKIEKSLGSFVMSIMSIF